MAKQIFSNEEYGQFLNTIGNDTAASTPVNMVFGNKQYSVMLNVAKSGAPAPQNVAIAFIGNQNGVEDFQIVNNFNGNIHHLFVEYLGDVPEIEENIN